MNEKITLFPPLRLKGRYLDRVLASGHYTTGPVVERLRRKLSEMYQWPENRIVLGNSATACFTGILQTWHGDLYSIRPDTWPLFPVMLAVRAREGKKNWGPPLEVYTDIGGCEAIQDRGFSHDAIRVKDACHTSQIHSAADFALVSFYPTKLLGGAEGGAVFCRRDFEASELQRIVDCGFPNTLQPGEVRQWRDRDPRGLKGNMTDVQAALALEAVAGFSRRKGRAYEAWHEAHDLWKQEFDLEDLHVVDVSSAPYLFQLEQVIGPRKSVKCSFPVGHHFPPNLRFTLPYHYPKARVRKIFIEFAQTWQASRW